MKKETDIISKTEDTIKIVDTYFLNILSSISVRHQRVCNCQRNLYNKFYLDLYNKEIETLKQDGLFDDEAAKFNRLEEVKWKSMEAVEVYCIANDIICDVERDMIANEIKLFVGRYDINDPRVYIIVKNALKLALNEHRLSLELGKNGVVYETMSKNGSTYTNINPAVEAAYKYNEACIKAVETLNRIIEGEKIDVTIGAKKTFQDILTEVQDAVILDDE